MHSIRYKLRWLGFVLYFAILFTLPFGFLANQTGTIIGLSLFCLILCYLRLTGKSRLLRRLKLKRLYPIDNPGLFASLSSYANRLEIPLPELYLLNSPGLNAACFSLSKNDSVLLVSQGLKDELPCNELIAVCARALVEMRSNGLRNRSWLSQFLLLIERPTTMDYIQNRSHTRRYYPVSIFIRQIILYPLSWLPIQLIGRIEDIKEMDEITISLTGDRRSLSEAFRRLEAFRERTPVYIPFCYQPLFLASSESIDPIAKVFVRSQSLNKRIHHLEGKQAR